MSLILVLLFVVQPTTNARPDKSSALADKRRPEKLTCIIPKFHDEYATTGTLRLTDEVFIDTTQGHEAIFPKVAQITVNEGSSLVRDQQGGFFTLAQELAHSVPGHIFYMACVIKTSSDGSNHEALCSSLDHGSEEGPIYTLVLQVDSECMVSTFTGLGLDLAGPEDKPVMTEITTNVAI